MASAMFSSGASKEPSKSSRVAILSLGLFLPSLTIASAAHALMLVMKPPVFGRLYFEMIEDEFCVSLDATIGGRGLRKEIDDSASHIYFDAVLNETSNFRQIKIDDLKIDIKDRRFSQWIAFGSQLQAASRHNSTLARSLCHQGRRELSAVRNVIQIKVQVINPEVRPP